MKYIISGLFLWGFWGYWLSNKNKFSLYVWLALIAGSLIYIYYSDYLLEQRALAVIESEKAIPTKVKTIPILP